MPFRPYHPVLITTLRLTLERIEAQFADEHRHALVELKSALVRALAEHEVEAESKDKPNLVVLILPGARKVSKPSTKVG